MLLTTVNREGKNHALLHVIPNIKGQVLHPMHKSLQTYIFLSQLYITCRHPGMNNNYANLNIPQQL